MKIHTSEDGRVTIKVVEHFSSVDEDGVGLVRDKVVLVDVQPRELMDEGVELFHQLYPNEVD